MATFYGSWVNDFRLRMDITGSGTSRTVAVYAEMGQGFDWTSTLSFGGSWSGSKQVSVYAPWGGGTQLLHSSTATYSSSGTRTYTASIPVVWPGGTASVSGSVSVQVGSAPGRPGQPTFSLNSDTSGTVSWPASSGATQYLVQRAYGGAAWVNQGNPSTNSLPISGLNLDASFQFRVYAINAYGQSSWSPDSALYYTKPKTLAAPSASVEASGVRVTVSGSYLFGVEFEREGGPAWSVGSGVGGQNSSYVDETAWGGNVRYRARQFRGVGTGRVFGDWSPWSVPVNVIGAPKITALSAERCDGAGNLLMTGTHLLVVSSGETTPVPIDGVETNKMTRQYRYRKAGDPWPSSWLTMVTGVDAGPWSNVAVIAGSGDIDVTEAWEVQLRVTDTYTSGDGTVQQTTVPVARVALALSKTGIGAGKVWERGALDVGGDAYVEGDLVVPGQPQIIAQGQTDQLGVIAENGWALATVEYAPLDTDNFSYSVLVSLSGTEAAADRCTVAVRQVGVEVATIRVRNVTSGATATGAIRVHWALIRRPKD